MTFTRHVSLALLLTLAPASAFAAGFKLIGDKAPNARVTRTEKGVEWTIGQGEHPTRLVYLHGLGGEPEDGLVNRVIKQLSATEGSFKVISPWLRPVRELDGEMVSAGPHTMTDQLARVRELLRNEPGPVVLMGHSFGGKAALALAKEFPDKVKGIVGFAPSVKMLYAHWKNLTGEKGVPEDRGRVIRRLDEHDGWLRGELQGVENALRRVPGWDHDEKERLEDKADYLRGELSYNATMRDLADHDETGLESTVKKPTLVFHGTDDKAVSIHYARRFAEANPTVRLVELQDLGHGLDNRRRFDRAHHEAVDRNMGTEIVRFLKQLDQQKGQVP
jgi:pimeloyl-ACP methyl ester carboxylesterase